MRVWVWGPTWQCSDRSLACCARTVALICSPGSCSKQQQAGSASTAPALRMWPLLATCTMHLLSERVVAPVTPPLHPFLPWPTFIFPKLRMSLRLTSPSW